MCMAINPWQLGIPNMCGIVGLFVNHFLAKANKLQSHRGPDAYADGIWFDVGLGIGRAHRRLFSLNFLPIWAQPSLAMIVWPMSVIQYSH